MKSVAKFDKDISMDWPSQQKLGVIQQNSGRMTPRYFGDSQGCLPHEKWRGEYKGL